MARKKIKPVEAPTITGPVVSRKTIDSRKLVTFGIDSGIWTGDSVGNVSGSIVRLVPPSDATDAKIEETKALAETAGAIAVKVLPRRVIGKVGSDDESVDPVSVDLREAVLEVAGRMSSENKQALFAELNAAMDEVGL